MVEGTPAADWLLMQSLRDAFLGMSFCDWLVSLWRDDALETLRKSVCKTKL